MLTRRTLLGSLIGAVAATAIPIKAKPKWTATVVNVQRPKEAVICHTVNCRRDRDDPRLWHCEIKFTDQTEISLSTRNATLLPKHVMCRWVGRPKSDFAFSFQEWKANA
jgi:hypothetical protein